jgi:hypothetical protein
MILFQFHQVLYFIISTTLVYNDDGFKETGILYTITVLVIFLA